MKIRRLLAILIAVSALWASRTYAQTCSEEFTPYAAEVTNSTCQSNGSIRIELTGNTTNLIRMEYGLSSVTSGGFSISPQPNKVLTGIPPGTYNITVRAFCQIDDDFEVVKTVGNVTVGGTYQVPVAAFSASASRKSYNDCNTGIIALDVQRGSGTYTFNIASAPAGVTLGAVSATKNGNIYTLAGSNYPAGNYTINVTDGCNDTRPVTFTLGTVTGYPTFSYSYSAFYPVTTNPDCNLVSWRLNTVSTTNPDYYRYYQDGMYEVGLGPATGTSPVSWVTWSGTPIQYSLGAYKYKDFWNSNSLRAYIRVKNCSTPTSYTSYFNKPGAYGTQTFICDTYNYSSTPWPDWEGLWCYPLNYELKNTSTNTVVGTGVANSSAAVNFTGLQYKVSYSLSGIDANGTTFSVSFQYGDNISIPTSYSYRRLYCSYFSQGYICSHATTSCPAHITVRDPSNNIVHDTIITNTNTNYVNNLQYGTNYTFREEYINSTTLSPVTVTLSAVSNSFPTSYSLTRPNAYNCTENNGNFYLSTNSSSINWPIGTTITITGPAGYTAQSYTATGSSYSYSFPQTIMPPGTYTATINHGCGTPITATYSHQGAYQVTSMNFTSTFGCSGMTIRPTGGITLNGSAVAANSVYYRLVSGPTGYDQTVITNSGSLTLTQAGTYTLRIQTTNGAGTTCGLKDTTITYTPTHLQLNTAKTAAYVCSGATIGEIIVAAQNGTTPYTYSLWNAANNAKIAGVADVVKSDNSNARFSYGGAGETYTVRISDGCGNNFSQQVTLIDLTTAHVAYSPGAVGGNVCQGADINLSCVTLGETNYNWEGPNGWTASNTQHPVIANAQPSMTGWYYITVRPEFCGLNKRDSVYINVLVTAKPAVPRPAIMYSKGATSATLLAASGATASAGHTLNWYNSANAPITPPSGNINTSTVGTTVYYVSQTNSATGCESEKVKVSVMILSELPDNISEEECYTDRPATVWDMEFKRQSSTNVHRLATPFVGDLDGDGRNEVVVPAAGTSGAATKGIHVFDDQLTLKLTIANDASSPSMYTEPNMPLLIADVDGDGKGEIVIAATDGYLYCHSYTGGQNPQSTQKWKSSETFDVKTVGHCPSLIVADIDGDGKTEILAVNKIFAGENGKRIVTLNTTVTSTGNTDGIGFATNNPGTYMPVFADIDNDGKQEVVAGNKVYKIVINDRNTPALNTANVLATAPSSLLDGFTSVADIDMDGDLDVIVTGGTTGKPFMYVWDGETSTQIGNFISSTLDGSNNRISRAFVGDITGNGRPDIAFTYTNRMEAYEYDVTVTPHVFKRLWKETTTDASGATTMTMFDFDQNGEVELVYRDETDLRIIGKDGNNKVTKPCFSRTHTEYPVIVDLDRDGHADILVSGASASNVAETDVRLQLFGSQTPNVWAPARSVWNQHAYNALNIKENLSVPRNPISPATPFPGPRKGTTSDPVYPYNGFLVQQTTLNMNGLPLWLTPDLYHDQSRSVMTLDGDSLYLKICIVNKGAAVTTSPLWVSLYKDSVSLVSKITTVSENITISPHGGVGYVEIKVPHITPFLPFVQLLVSINDKGTTYLVQEECDSLNNDVTEVNPGLHLMMKKNANLNSVPDNGQYANPVSVLYNENIEYTIQAVNASLSTETVTIVDTLPAYLKYAGSITGLTAPANTPSSETPPRDILTWTLPNMLPESAVSVGAKATPQTGVVASQPLFVNKAWVKNSQFIVPTNSVYHQGAGVSLVTFSAGVGGWIFNASPQAVDYKTSARSGVLVAPDSGYRFAGWAHDGYVSMRGAEIAPQEGVALYDTLTVYGDVELRAVFVPETSDVAYGEEKEAVLTDEKAWAYDGELHVLTVKPSSIIRVYTVDGALRRQQVALSAGETVIKQLAAGVYIVTVNSGAGWKVQVEN